MSKENGFKFSEYFFKDNSIEAKSERLRIGLERVGGGSVPAIASKLDHNENYCTDEESDLKFNNEEIKIDLVNAEEIKNGVSHVSLSKESDPIFALKYAIGLDPAINSNHQNDDEQTQEETLQYVSDLLEITQKELSESKETIKELKREVFSLKPLYSRRKLMEENKKLKDALKQNYISIEGYL
jgi:hypothetical protein